MLVFQVVSSDREEVNRIISSISNTIKAPIALIGTQDEYSSEKTQIQALVDAGEQYICLTCQSCTQNAVYHLKQLNALPQFTALCVDKLSSEQARVMDRNELRYKLLPAHENDMAMEYIMAQLKVDSGTGQEPRDVGQSNVVLLDQLKRLNDYITVMQNSSDFAKLEEFLKIENQRLREQNVALFQQLYGKNTLDQDERQTQQSCSSACGQLQQQPQSSKPVIKDLDELQQRQLAKQQQICLQSDHVRFDNIKKTIPKRLICGICLEPFKQPITLQCGHSFCMRCLDIYEQFWFQRNEGYDTLYRCPGLVSSDKCTLGVIQCQHEYEDTPPVDPALTAEVNELIQFNERIQVGDYVYMFGDDFGQVLRVDTCSYNMKTRELLENSQEDPKNGNITLVHVATVRTLDDAVIRTEAFNITKLYPQFTAVSTRICQSDYIVKIQPPFRIQLKQGSYYPQLQKFGPKYKGSYCREDTQIYQIVGFQANKFVLRDKCGVIKHENSLDSYFSLQIRQQLYSTDGECLICVACQQRCRLRVQPKCGCRHCMFCLMKLIRNKVPCFGCGRELEYEGIYPSLEQDVLEELHNEYKSLQQQAASQGADSDTQTLPVSQFLEQNLPCILRQEICFITQTLNSQEAVIQRVTGERQIENIHNLQPIDFTQLVPALRPKNGDICIQLNAHYACLAVVHGGSVVGLFRRYSLTYNNALQRTVRLINSTAVSEQMCSFCYQFVKRPTSLPCGHVACRTCTIIAAVNKTQCVVCGHKFMFKECRTLDDQQVDIGTVSTKKHSRINSYGSQFGFIRQTGDDSHDVAFSSVTQRIDQYDLIYIGQNAMIHVQDNPSLNELAYIVDNGDGLDGVYCLVLATDQRKGTFKVLTETGAVLDNVYAMKVEVNIGGKLAK